MTGFLYQNKLCGREQDGAETERESVCVRERDRALLEMRDGIGNKMDH
jgi:hypothetical protein